MSSKICNYCKETKPLEDFVKGKNKCKSCKNEIEKERSRLKRVANKVEKIVPENKTCKECKESKPLDEFSNGRATCKICRSEIESKKQKEQRAIKKEEEKSIPPPPPPTEKKCTGCDETKPLEEFPEGRNKCKICRNVEGKESYDKNHKKKPVCLEPNKKICSICEETKNEDDFIKDRNICKSCKQELSQKNYKKDANIHMENLHLMKTCIECGIDKKIERFAISKNCCRKCRHKYSLNYHNERKKYDPAFKIRCNLATRIRSALKYKSVEKQYATLVLTDCTPIFLKEWLEYHFDSKMSWENYGSYWHMDHVIPCASFNFLDEEEQFKCFNWKNLRPCEGKENISKGAKIDDWQILLQEIRVKYYILIKK